MTDLARPSGTTFATAQPQANYNKTSPQSQSPSQYPIYTEQPQTTMPELTCSVTDCGWKTEDVDSIAAAALLNSHMFNHTARLQGNINPVRASAQKLPRPTISTNSTPEEWRYFCDKWTNYKSATGIQGDEIIFHLTDCCDNKLQLNVFRTHGNLKGKSESDALAAIKELAVQKENKTVARATLLQTKQDYGEPITSYVARLKGLASSCEYSMTKKCTQDHDVTFDYAEIIIRDVVVTGINDPEIQADILGHTDQDMKLEALIKFIEAKEDGKKSIALLNPQAASGIKSQFQRQKKQFMTTQRRPFRGITPSNKDFKKETPHTGKKPLVECRYCGFTGHGYSRVREARKGVCPAIDIQCTKCGYFDHFGRKCEKSSSPATQGTSAIATDGKSNIQNSDELENDAVLLTAGGISINE